MTVPLSIVVSTYEWPEALDVVLAALADQSEPAFEIVVADDGSGVQTGTVIDRWTGLFADRLTRVWQPDQGFRKARILNLAALTARGAYLLFLDGDCIPRRRYVESVLRAALPGWFLAGKRLNLGADLSQRVLQERLPVWRWSAATWLVRAPRDVGRPGLMLPLRDRRRPWRRGQPEFSPPYDGYGFLFGVARDDFERVNGFDLRFHGWGGEDVEIATRLRRIGLNCGWPGPRSTVLHLWHPARKGTTKSNTPLVEATAASASVEAVEGLRELR